MFVTSWGGVLTGRANIGTAGQRCAILGRHLVTGGDSQGPAGLAGELRITMTSLAMFRAQVPFLQSTKCQVFSQKEVESGIHTGQGIVAHKCNAVELLQYLADLRGAVPPVGTACYCQ